MSLALWPGLLWSTKITSSASEAFVIKVGASTLKYYKANLDSLFNGPKRHDIT